MSEWAATLDKKSGKTYYYNKATKEVSWEMPDGFEDEQDESAKKKDKKKKKKKAEEEEEEEEAAAAEDDEDAEANPANWSKTEDKSTGKSYFYNKITRKTSWKPPPCWPADEPETGKKDKKKKKMKEEEDEDEEQAEEEVSVSVKKSKSKSDDKEEWAAAEDPSSGRTYWYNKKTKETTWKDPNKKKKAAADDDEEEFSRAAAADEDNSSSLKGKPRSKKQAEPEMTEEQAAAAAKAKAKAEARENAMRADAEGDKGDEEGDGGELELQDEDEQDDVGHSYRFAKHRKGFFNRLFRIGEVHDNTQLLTFKKSLIKKALLKQNRDLDEEAVQAFKNIMSYMGDRSSSKKDQFEHARKLLRNLMMAPAGLRDEVYMQLVKQTTQNPKVSSCVCGWELMSFVSPPSPLRSISRDFCSTT